MGEIRRLKCRHCLICDREATAACKAASHSTESRERPTYWIRYYRDGRRHEESAHTDKYEKARELLKKREGAVADGVPITAKIGRVRFEDVAKDLLTDYKINGKRSHDNLKSTIIEGALEPWFRGRRMASLTTTDIRA